LFPDASLSRKLASVFPLVIRVFPGNDVRYGINLVSQGIVVGFEFVDPVFEFQLRLWAFAEILHAVRFA
jgi:hypothetical protein